MDWDALRVSLWLGAGTLAGAQPQVNGAPGGFEGGGGGERFPRRRRRPHGPRPEREAAPAASGDDLAPSE